MTNAEKLLVGTSPAPWNFCECGCNFLGGGDDHVATIIVGEWGDRGTNIFTGEETLVHHWGTVSPETARANGRLAAAAPDLAKEVASLRQIVGVMESALSQIAGNNWRDQTRARAVARDALHQLEGLK